MLRYEPNNFAGINYGSPTVQNIVNQNQQLNFYNQAPQIGNIGGLGYNNPFLTAMNTPDYNQMMNGGYYSGFYNYDPVAIREQMEYEKKVEEQKIRNTVEIQKLKARIYNTYYDMETDEDYIEELFNPNTYDEINKDLNDYERMRELSDISNDPGRLISTYNESAVYNMSRISQDIRSKHPVDQSFVDFMNTAGDIYVEALVNENARELKRNIANTYDKQAYNQLANMHRQSSFASLRQSTSVDDLSISLPAHLKNSYQERKAQFINYITQNDIRNRGGI